MTGDEDFTRPDDSALLRRRAEMRAELDLIPPTSHAHTTLTALYDRSTQEVNDRASAAWPQAREDNQ